jgi:elongation factor 1-gamma
LKEVLVKAETAKFVAVTRWLDTLFNQPQFKAVLGEVVQTTTEAQPKKEEKAAAPKKEKAAPAAGEKAGKKEDAKKADKPKAEKAAAKAAPEEKKAPAPAAAPAAAAAAAPAKSGKDEDLSHLLDDDDKPAAPKVKNPLDSLPKSPMILDAVKKLMFSKKPHNPDFFNQLWNGTDEVTKFDPAGYSVYTCDYKYNDEHKVYFLTCNLIGGFLQRVERLRKYGFGTINLLGASEDSPPWQLCGIWIFRGQEIPAEMKECDDSEHFNFQKVDVTTAAGKALLEEHFVADNVYGKLCLERRYFK